MSKIYIKRKGDGYLETVDEFDTRKEAREMCREYSVSDSSGYYYTSTRPCKDWNNEQSCYTKLVIINLWFDQIQFQNTLYS